MTKRFKLWVAEYRAWGADKPYHRYFSTKYDRDYWVNHNNYTKKAGTILVTPEEYWNGWEGMDA